MPSEKATPEPPQKPATKSRKKAGKKDSQLIIRINSEERQQFVQLCEDLDTSAAREVRHFIRAFVKQHNVDED